jgi:ribosome-binding protein aMBF1 (putative translation factor)
MWRGTRAQHTAYLSGVNQTALSERCRSSGVKVQDAMDDIRRLLADNIIRLRNAKGWSQEVAAYEARVARRYMARIEGGQAKVGIDVIAKIAAKLDVQPYELLMPPSKRAKK